MTEEICLRLKLPTKLIEEVTYAVKNHMNAHTLWSWKKDWKIRRFIGHPLFQRVYNVAIADELGSISKEHDVSLESVVKDAFGKWPVMLPEPIVTGKTLVGLGLKPGPSFSEILTLAYNSQLDGKSKEAIFKALPKRS